MPRPRTGSIRQEGDHYVARVLLDDKYARLHLPPGLSEARARETAQFYSDNPDKARQLLRAQEYARRGLEPKKGGETVNEYFERWLEERDKRGLSNIGGDRSKYRNYIGAIIGEIPIAKLTRDDVEQVVRHLDDKVTSGDIRWRTAYRIWEVLSKMMRDSARSKRKELRVREANPAADVLPPERGDERSQSFLYPREFLQLITCEEIPLDWRRWYCLAVYLYTRGAELWRLRWEDVNLEHGIIIIRRGWDRWRKAEKGTKGRRPRQFRIEPHVLPLLRALYEETSGEGRVLPLKLKKVADRFQWCLRTAGITRAELFTDDDRTKRLTMHDLRATGITWMALRKDPPLAIQDRAGHASLDVTQRYIRAAESLVDVGTPFPELPASLLERKPSEFLSGRAKRAEIARQKFYCPPYPPRGIRPDERANIGWLCPPSPPRGSDRKPPREAGRSRARARRSDRGRSS